MTVISDRARQTPTDHPVTGNQAAKHSLQPRFDAHRFGTLGSHSTAELDLTPILENASAKNPKCNHNILIDGGEEGLCWAKSAWFLSFARAQELQQQEAFIERIVKLIDQDSSSRLSTRWAASVLTIANRSAFFTLTNGSFSSSVHEVLYAATAARFRANEKDPNKQVMTEDGPKTQWAVMQEKDGGYASMAAEIYKAFTDDNFYTDSFSQHSDDPTTQSGCRSAMIRYQDPSKIKGGHFDIAVNDTKFGGSNNRTCLIGLTKERYNYHRMLLLSEKRHPEEEHGTAAIKTDIKHLIEMLEKRAWRAQEITNTLGNN